jgi:putative transposase
MRLVKEAIVCFQWVTATPHMEHTMTDPTMALMEYLRDTGIEGDESFLQEGVQRLAQTVIELEAAEQVGAGRLERSPERKTYRNGHWERVWEARVGEIPLRIPEVRDGTYFPSMLEPRRRSEKALLAVVQQAYVEGVSTRRVDDLLQALGLTGIDKSRVSRICKELDEVVEPFRNRPVEGKYPFIWLDALYLKVRHNHRIVGQALVIATGVRESGGRECWDLPWEPARKKLSGLISSRKDTGTVCGVWCGGA